MLQRLHQHRLAWQHHPRQQLRQQRYHRVSQ